MATNLMLGINFTLLAADLSAAYLKTGNGYKLLLKPAAPDNNKGMSIGEMVADINGMIQEFSGSKGDLNVDDVQSKLAVGEKKPDAAAWERIRVKLSMAYLHIEKEGEISKVMDFAFKLDVDMSEFLPDIKVINISSLMLAVWNTDNKEIMDRMNLALLEAENKN